MELKDLVGEHILTGVDMDSKDYGDSQAIRFTLDGKTYVAVEDPEDGYRSCMGELIEINESLPNTFKSQKVVGTMRDDTSDDVLDLIDVKTGKIVVSVGTSNTNDYYPWFTAEFNPENMAVNAKSE
jgi:hypothetical protein